MNKPKNIPELRFPEFEENGEWKEKSFGKAIKSESSQITLKNISFKQEGYSLYGADGFLGFTDFFEQDNAYIAIIKDGSGVGRTILCLPESSVLATLTYLKPKNDKRYNLRWLYYLLKTIDFKVFVKGGGIPHIYYSDYKKKKILIPSLTEQQKIAACLSSLDKVIDLEEEKLTALKAHKKGLLQKLFPEKGKTVPEYRFPEFENDGGWIKEKLENVANYENGKAHEKEITKNGQYIVINSKFISSDREVIKKTDNANCLAEKGDIVMVLSDVPNGKAIAKCFLVDENNKFTVNQRICVIRTKKLNNAFLFYILNRNKYFLKFDDGVKQTNLRKEVVLNFAVLHPKSDDEQQKIANVLSSLDEVIENQGQKIEALKTHKKGLLQQIFPKMN